MIWAVLAFWWVAYPLLPKSGANLWHAHLAVVVALCAAALPRLWRSPQLRLGVPFAATAVAAISLLAATVIRPDGFPAADRWWGALTGWAHGLFFLVCLAVMPSREEAPDPEVAGDVDGASVFRRARLALTLLLAGVVLGQAAVVVADSDEVARATGTLGNPNVLGALVAALGLSLAALARWRLGTVLLLSTLVFLVMVTRSRGAVAAGGVTLLALGMRRRWQTVAALGLAASLVLILVPNPIWERVVALRSEHQFSRPFMWSAAVTNIAEHPWGTGVGMNRYVFPPLAWHAEHPWLLHQRHAVGLTHNVYLTLVLEWGWLAGAAIVTLTLWAVGRLWPRRAPDALGQCGALGACVLFLELQVDGLEQNPVVFSIFLALAALALRRLPAQERGWAVPGRVAAVALALVAAGLGVETVERVQRTVALRDAREAQTAWSGGELSTPAVRQAWDAARSVAPDDWGPAAESFEFEFAMARRAVDEGATPAELEPVVDAGWEALRHARRCNAVDPRLVRREADYALWQYRRTGQPPEALATYFTAMETLLALDPLDVEGRWELAQEAQRVGDLPLMRDQLDLLFRYEPDDAFAWWVLGSLRAAEGDREGALYAWVRCEEAILNCRIKAQAPSPRSQRYFRRILDRLDLKTVRRRIGALRRELYG